MTGRVLTRIDRILERLSVVGATLATVAIAILLMIIVASVVLRTNGSSLPGVVEYSEILLVAIAFLGMGYGQRHGIHVSASVLTDRMPSPLAGYAKGAGLMIGAAFTGWMAYLAVGRAWTSTVAGESRFGIMEVPIWPARILLAVGLIFLTVELLRSVVLELAGRNTRRALAETEAGVL